MPKKYRYLVKSSSDGVCHCTCKEALIAAPGQLDCPWCGCGWLYTCIDCRKAFTFARCVEVPVSYEELARRDISKREGAKRPISAWEVRTWTKCMADVMSGLTPGKEYVYLDGSFFALDEHIEFDGWHSHHFLPALPHVELRADSAKLKAFFSNRDYWLNSKVEAEDL